MTTDTTATATVALDRNGFEILTGWISLDEAKTKLAELKAADEFETLKKSSYKWADLKDHSKGYLCRILGKGRKSKDEQTAEVEEH